jgi:hypothetical protein
MKDKSEKDPWHGWAEKRKLAHFSRRRRLPVPN